MRAGALSALILNNLRFQTCPPLRPTSKLPLVRTSHNPPDDVAHAPTRAVSRLFPTLRRAATQRSEAERPQEWRRGTQSACATTSPTNVCEKCGLALRQSVSGKEPIEHGFELDIDVASELNVSQHVPRLVNRATCGELSGEELAQNGVRREAVPDPRGGARRTLCACETLKAMVRAALTDAFSPRCLHCSRRKRLRRPCVLPRSSRCRLRQPISTQGQEQTAREARRIRADVQVRPIRTDLRVADQARAGHRRSVPTPTPCILFFS